MGQKLLPSGCGDFATDLDGLATVGQDHRVKNLATCEAAIAAELILATPVTKIRKPFRTHESATPRAGKVCHA